LAAVLAFAGCSLDKQAAPPLTGPSELGLSLAVTATPDVITQDGQSQSTIQVIARDSNGQLKSDPVTLRVETYVGSTPIDIGTLSSKVVTTDTQGRAALTYRAPAAPPPSAAADTVVTVVVTPVGNDYAGATPRYAEIRLARPGVIIPPGDGPVASFFFSPSSPREDDDVFFDGSASTGNIVSYTWNFGDGRSDSSSSPTVRHHFGLAGTYSVTLTVRDNVGREATSAPKTVTITALTPATQLAAKLVISPSSSVKPGDLLTFDASTSTAAPGHTIVQYSFNFGDGSPIVVGSSPYAHYAYPSGVSGTSTTYKVVLIVTDDTGRTASSSDGSVAVATP
jgi:PKD repeat protein